MGSRYRKPGPAFTVLFGDGGVEAVEPPFGFAAAESPAGNTGGFSRSGAAIADSPGSDLDERIEALPEPQLFNALVCLFHLGWID